MEIKEKKNMYMFIGTLMIIVFLGTMAVTSTLWQQPQQTFEERGPTLTLIPSKRGIQVSEGYGILSFSGEAAGIQLPEGYSIPASIEIYSLKTYKAEYTIIIGDSPLPAEKERNIPLTEEIVIENIQRGVTKIILLPL